jgi:hypothetical protein
MRYAIGAALMLATAGCAQTRMHWQDAAVGAPPPPSTFTQEMVQAIQFVEITYGNGIPDTWTKRTTAATRFSEAGYNSLYYLPQYNWFIRDPNLFVLGQRHSHELMILFTGTEVYDNPYDIIQDTKTNLFLDDPDPGDLYLPAGHAGFRAGVLNLINVGFLPRELTMNDLRGEGCDRRRTSRLIEFICRYEIADPARTDPIEVTIVGHSLGAGLAQIATPPFEGLSWYNDGSQDEPDWRVRRREGWPFRVRHLFAFAPPFAVYSHDDDTCDEIERNNPIQILRDASLYDGPTLYDRASMIIHEGDMVPVLWNPVRRNMHCVPGQHFGRLYSIPRDGSAMEDGREENWRINRPHASRSYQDAIEAWAARQQ